MTDESAQIAQAKVRGSVSGFTNAADIKLPSNIDRGKSKIVLPLQMGALTLHHRIVHPGLGRSRSDFGAESPLATKYFAQRATPGSLVISQATGVSGEAVAWQWAASLHNSAQQAALVPVIQAVHDKGGYWFQQLFHPGRNTTPALVKLSRDRAGLDAPTYGYRPVSSSEVAESGLNTHSGESPGIPHSLMIEEIHAIRDDYKRAALRAVEAGADGIEVLGGNGWLIDQFLHDNINKRTDEYGGTVENRSRFALEVVDAIAEVVGYQRIGIRLSPFSYFHETDGSQPLQQILHLSRELVLRGIAYLHVGQSRFTRNITPEQNERRLVSKGISPEDISLRPFRRLLSSTRPTDPRATQTVLIGNGGYDEVSGILAVEDGLADAVSFGRRFISNPDLVERIRLGYPLTPNDLSTFYTHGAKGYTSYEPYKSPQGSPTEKLQVIPPPSPITAQAKKQVAIIGAGVSGISSAASLARVGGFDVRIFERRGAAGGSWAHDAVPVPKPQVLAVEPVPISQAIQQGFCTTPLHSTRRVSIPHNVLGGNSIWELPAPQDPSSPFLSEEEISTAVEKRARDFQYLIELRTTVEDVEKLPSGRLRLILRKENPNDDDTWTEEEFDHLVVATGHKTEPRIPRIPGLDQWTRNLRHIMTWRSEEKFSGQRILIIGNDDMSIDFTIQTLPYVIGPLYISQRTPHPQYASIFARSGVEVVPSVAKLTGNVIHLSDGRTFDNIDTIILATGYLRTYPFLSSKIRPPPIDGYRIPGLYQHIFDIYNPETIAFNGVVNGALAWLTWEKSAFLIALLWSEKIRLPSKEVQEAWESRRLAETGDKKFHILGTTPERVIYFDELNETAAEYLHTEAEDDILLRSFPFGWVLEWLKSRVLLARLYGITSDVAGKGPV